jgi:hypothetical protein
MRFSFPRILAIISILAATACSWATGDLIMSEKLKEKVACTDTGCSETQSGQFRGFAFVQIGNALIDSLDKQSTFTLTVGDFDFVRTLGDDPNYDTGETAATFQDVVQTTSGTLVFLKVKLNWSDGDLLRVKIKGITPYAASPVAADLVGTSQGFKSKDVAAEVSLASSTRSRGISTSSMPFHGFLWRRTKNVNGTDYDLDRIYLLGEFSE